ncbi:MAG: hypothetical protein ACFCVB_15495 [Nodosilinea sp.]
MKTSSLLEQAQEGDAGAIAALLNSSLKPKGITVRAERESYSLYLWFTGSPAPPQAATVAYARRVIERLQAPTIGILQLYGEQTGFTQPAWSEEISLLSLGSDVAMEADPYPREALPPTDDADPTPPAFEPSDVVHSSTAVGVVRAYAELGLSLGDSLAQVEAVYFKRRAELLRRGDRAALEPLKWAFGTLKTHLEQSATTETITTTTTETTVYSASYSTTLGTDLPTPGGNSTLRSQPRQTNPRPGPPPLVDDTDVLSFQNRYSNGLVFPALLLLGMLMNAMPIVNALLFGIKIWFHEFGHAVIAWLSGRQALPLPIGWTSYNPQRSLFVYLGLLTLLGLLFWAGRREGKRWPMVLAATLAVVQFAMTWLLPAKSFNMLMAFGGIGGEIYLAALLIVGFYFPLPNYFRWDFYRFPVVVGAAFCFWGQLWLWGKIRQGQASIPFGALWGEAEHGDMNQLANLHGWTPGDIIGTYSAIAHLCLFAIVAVYGYTLVRQHRDFFIALGRQWLP